MTVLGDNYNYIEKAVTVQTQRLLPMLGSMGGLSSRVKAEKINDALDRLYTMVVKVCQTETNIPTRFIAIKPKLDPEQVSKIDLSTIDLMLDAEICEWKSEIAPWTEQGMEFNGRRAGFEREISLRQALNIAQNNLFNFAGGTWGPLWGKATALENVEAALRKV